MMPALPDILDPPTRAEVPSTEPAEMYWKAVILNAPRVLGLVDREYFSPTYGCFDRTFWAWKFTDFPGARFQEGLCVLSFLYATARADNPYADNPHLLEWIAGGFDFWARIQRSAGDFDEAYPFERSLAATSFTAFYLGEAWRFVAKELPEATRSRFRRAIASAGNWLIRNDERHGFLSNHLAAAAGALYHAYEITGEERFEERSRYFIDKILSHQSSEGWYDEYGGADPGYQTHGSFYLARYQQLSRHRALTESLDRSFRFLIHFIHPDLSLGGEYTSRNTQTYYPAAFEMMAAKSGAANWIAKEMRPAVRSLAAAGVGSVDIYNFFPLLNNYVFAHLGAIDTAERALPPEGPSEGAGELHFPQAGLLKVRRARYELYVGLQKGGVLKLFDRASRRLVLAQSGYIGRLANGKTFSNQWTVPDRHVCLGSSEVGITGSFYQVSRPVMTPTRFIAFRVFGITVGRFKPVAYWLKSLLVRVLIYRTDELDLRFRRRVVFLEDGVEVCDYLQGAEKKVETLEPRAIFTTVHMGSSRYFIPNELTATSHLDDFDAPIDPKALARGVERKRRVRLRMPGG